MSTKKLNKKNCCFIYGDDIVSLNLRKDGLLKAYFQGNPPDPVTFDGQGSYEEYRNALEGQSLFTSETAVIIQNPFFLKRAAKSEKEEKQQADFLQLLAELPPEIFCLILLEGKADSRTKIVKNLLSICYSEKLTLMDPKDAPQAMIRMLQNAGKRVDFPARAYLEMILPTWTEISLPLLQTECDKIVLMCGDQSTVTKDMLELALPDYMNQGVFKFINVLLDKNANAVMERADRVFDAATVIPKLGAVTTKFRQIKMLKEMQRNRVPEKRMQQILGINNSWVWKYLLADARKVTETEAEWFLMESFKYLLKSRQGASEMDLKDLLLKYCMK